MVEHGETEHSAGRFCTPEPLGPGGDPYPAMYGKTNAARLGALVRKTVRVFRQREASLF
jgi:D-psicose/D-tagatose/L-ribulose 3-epimerase